MRHRLAQPVNYRFALFISHFLRQVAPVALREHGDLAKHAVLEFGGLVSTFGGLRLGVLALLPLILRHLLLADAGTSRATATRDLQDLVQRQALLRTGTLKGTRYHLPIPVAPQP